MTKMSDICPNCSSNLILKDGQFGEFLACPRFPDCKYTRPLQELEELYKAPSPYCDKCSKTGLLPFVKNGKVIPNALVDCECKLSLIEHYDPVRPLPSDFDFPMSDIFRAYTYQYCNQQDPLLEMQPPWGSREEELPDSNNISITDSIRGEGRGTYIEHNHLRGMVLYLQSKLNEHLDKSKTKAKREW